MTLREKTNVWCLFIYDYVTQRIIQERGHL